MFNCHFVGNYGLVGVCYEIKIVGGNLCIWVGCRISSINKIDFFVNCFVRIEYKEKYYVGYSE